jgi:outer membrane immunogenic protein
MTSDRYRLLLTGTAVLAASTNDDTHHLFMLDRTHTFVDTARVFFGTDRIRQDVDLVTVRGN